MWSSLFWPVRGEAHSSCCPQTFLIITAALVRGLRHEYTSLVLVDARDSSFDDEVNGKGHLLSRRAF